MDEFLSWLLGLVAIVLPNFGAAPEQSWNGYVEADYVYVAASAPGIIETIAVEEGQVVRHGELRCCAPQRRGSRLPSPMRRISPPAVAPRRCR
jgi:hypothetical protein